MSNPHENDHWRELADLLGLPPDGNQAASAPSFPSAAQKREPEEPETEVGAAEEGRSEHRINQPEDFAVDSREEVALDETPRFDERPDDSSPAEWTADGPGEPPPAEAQSGADRESRNDRPRRGRRRGRRGQREDRDSAVDEPRARTDDSSQRVNEPVGADKPDEGLGETGDDIFGAEDAGGPGHGGSRSDETPPRDFEEDGPDMEDTEQAEPIVEDEGDDEEIDKLTDWNVPSWAELIGSLYRPER